MRLALGFCGQFAKTTFSSSVKKLEVGHHIEVRRAFLCVCVCCGGIAVCVDAF